MSFSFCMKLKILYTLFILLGITGCCFANFGMTIEAIVFRSSCLLMVALIYYSYNYLSNIFFYLGLFVSGFGEALLVLGFENYPIPVILCFISYAWLLIFMVKKDTNKITIKIEKNKLLLILISIALIIYLFINILILITPNLRISVYYGYFFIISFFIMSIYFGFIYMNTDSIRYVWILLFMFVVVISISITSLEAFYFPSKIFSQISYLTQIASHFFLLKFFISKDVKFKF